MNARWFRDFAPARFLGPAVFLLAALALPQPAPAAAAVGSQAGDHAAAQAALSDVKAAIDTLVAANMSYSTNRVDYHRASQRAINALEGTRGKYYAAGVGSPGDEQGAIGHIDALLDRKATPVWAAPLHGAEANLRAAVVHLRDSLKARELMDYEIAVSRALAYLEVAQGRPTETGVLAGLEGALANTVLGVPYGVHQEDACTTPQAAPAYGTHGGLIAWVTVPADAGTHTLAENPGGTDVTVQGNMVVLHTAAAPMVAKACGAHAAGQPAAQHATTQQPSQPQPAQAQQQAMQKPTAATPAQGGPPPALYTLGQARKGAAIYASKCVACHGSNMQGTAAPSVAGTDFLTTAKRNGWTLQAIRYLVFNIMPFNAPHSLSDSSYAAVMAFLLASNCYPAGNTPFPTEDQPSFGKVKLGPVPGHPAGQNSLGVCKVP